MARSISELLAPTVADPDVTLTALDVFEDKSKDADDAMEYGMGLSEEELLDIVMSVTPMGSVKAGKGAISFLKGLLGRAKSKAKFPVGYGEPTRDVAKKELEKFFVQRKLAEMEFKKPSGMRQFGKFNRKQLPERAATPDPEEYGGVWTDYITPEDALKGDAPTWLRELIKRK